MCKKTSCNTAVKLELDVKLYLEKKIEKKTDECNTTGSYERLKLLLK